MMASRSEAASLKVSPGRFMVQNVKPGRLCDVYKDAGLRLTIYNDDSTTRSWLLSVHRPSERGKWETGYAEIPNAEWCWFDHAEVTIGPGSKAYAHLFLKIPEDEKYLNQHWVVTLGVAGKPGRGAFSLAVDVRAQIETACKADIQARPDGPLGLKPSSVVFADAQPGKHEKVSVVVCNNEATTRSYTITSLFEHKEIEPKAYLTQFCDPIPDSGWIRRKQTLRIGAREEAVLDLDLQVPDNATNLGKKWEDILLVQPDEGRPGFIRIKVQTRNKANAG
jgi:hypothetical protein